MEGGAFAESPSSALWYNHSNNPSTPHPGDSPRANFKAISYGYYLILVAFAWELTKETIYLPLGCLQGGKPLTVKPNGAFAESPSSALW